MQISWNIGFPGWRLASKFGCPIKVKIDVFKDVEAGVYFATCNSIGLAVESESLDGILEEIHAATPVLLETSYTLLHEPKADIHLHDDLATA
ncbi:MAG: DUF1902 domain-containing protein [Gallionella sp.]